METKDYLTVEHAYREIIRTAKINPRNATIASFWERELMKFQTSKPSQPDGLFTTRRRLF